MRKIDAVYAYLLAEVRRLCDNTDEVYWTSLSEPQAQQFDALCDSLSEFKVHLEECYATRSVSNRLDELRAVFEKIQSDFSNYPEFDYPRVSYQLAVTEKICSSVGGIADEDVNSDFGFFPCELSFSCGAFVSNVTPLASNLVWLNPVETGSLSALVACETNIEIWYCLASFSDEIDFSSSSEILVCPSACVAAKSNMISLLKIYMVSKGKKITKTIEYIKNPKNSSIDLYDPMLNYAQFGDVVQIMGEYVDRADVLSKYLSIYHVIENFMFKSPIVRLERARGGVMFSIRDFRTLYKAVETSEVNAIKDLMAHAFQLPFNTSTIGAVIYKSWRDFLAAHAVHETDIDIFLAKIGMSKSFTANLDGFRVFFAKALYYIRCSIVHNKETEFHISSETYCQGCKLVLEEFYLPALEELVFLLISKDNDVVWYQSDSIALWDKTA